MPSAINRSLLLIATLSLLPLAACQTNNDRVRPDMDETLRGEHGLQSRDLREMTDKMAPDLLQIPEISANPTRIVVVMKGMENKTDITGPDAGKDMDIYVARLAGLLNSSRAPRDRILFVEQQKTLNKMRSEELGNPDPFEDASRGGPGGADVSIKPQYFLYGEIYSMNSGKTTYYLCKFKLTSAATGAIVWSNQYETRTLN